MAFLATLKFCETPLLMVAPVHLVVPGKQKSKNKQRSGPVFAFERVSGFYHLPITVCTKAFHVCLQNKHSRTRVITKSDIKLVFHVFVW